MNGGKKYTRKNRIRYIEHPIDNNEIIEIILKNDNIVLNDSVLASHILNILPPISIRLDYHGVLDTTNEYDLLPNNNYCVISYVGRNSPTRASVRNDLIKRINNNQIEFAVLVFVKGYSHKEKNSFIVPGSKAWVNKYIQPVVGKPIIFIDDTKEHIHSTQLLCNYINSIYYKKTDNLVDVLLKSFDISKPNFFEGGANIPPTNISSMIAIFNAVFGENWVLTGSVAVQLYAETFGIPYTIPPSDLDILYVAPEFNRASFFQFNRRQTAPEKSMTYDGPNNISFDISVVPRARYIEINGVRLADPRDLLKDYRTYVGNVGRREKETANYAKINVLHALIPLIDYSYVRTLSIPSKRNTRRNISPIQSRIRRPPLLSFNLDSNSE